MSTTPRTDTVRFTTTTIRRVRGILKRRPGQKPLAEEWAEHKKAERELEEAKQKYQQT
jgi:hypothetical protein